MWPGTHGSRSRQALCAHYPRSPLRTDTEGQHLVQHSDTRPDCAATAFAALAGFAYDEVDFGIAVTQHCAAHLSRVFGFRVAGPVDAALAPAGLPVVQGGESADVLRRGDDGRWRIALDNPWGARILS
jgi:hypothetical protein